MNSHAPSFFVGCFLALLAFSPSAANSPDCGDKEVVTQSEHITHGDITVALTTAPTAASPNKEGFRWGGEEKEAPRVLISAIHITIRGKAVFLPLSAYSDLGDPHKATVHATRTGFVLTITGGDAAGSYKAVLVFKNGELVRRHVSSGEFPDEAWEETVYKYNHISD